MWLLAFLGKDPRTAQSSDARNSLFATNLEDRGPSNLLKKQYMTALTCDKLPIYESKIDAAIDKFYNDITTEDKPVMSSWYERVFELYLDLHLDGPNGEDHPDYVVEYIRLFTDLIAPGRDDYVLSLRRQEAARGSCLLPFVEVYFEERRQFIVDNEITSTFVFWWNQAGIARESVLFEAVHNVLAWGQFLNILFLVIRAQVQGFVAIENLLRDPATPTFDFFQALKQASTENERMDVAREAFRMLVPNQFWLSQAERLGAGYNNGRFIADSGFDRPYVILFPLVIQAINDNFSPFTFDSDVARYDTGRYADFQPDDCPFMNSQFITNETEFIVSEVDGETVIPASHSKFFPVYKAGSHEGGRINGVKYCPFGLGYRRCPAESFNIFILEKLLDRLGNLEFRVQPPNDDLFEDIEPGHPDFDDGIPMALSRARDNIFASIA